MSKVRCINCSEFHELDSIDGKSEDKRAKVTYTCSKNEVKYGAYRLVRELEDVSQQENELVA